MSQVLPDRILGPAPFQVWTDLHLRPEAPEEIRAFAAQVDEVPTGATLLILGDLFDAWTGPESVADPAFDPLRVVLRGRREADGRTILLRGNRDVLLEPRQAEALGLQLADRVLAEAPRGPILFSHGDEYCLNDKPYQRLRRSLRRPAVRRLLRALPAALRIRLGRRMRRHSQGAVARKPLDILALDLEAAELAVRAAGARLGVIGHLHQAARHALPSDRELLVLPAWEPGQTPWTTP